MSNQQIKRGKLGFRGLLIIITNELKALRANKHLIYGSLLTPILYFTFFSIGIQSSFGDIYFRGEMVSFMSFSMIGIFAISIFREMYQCVYRMVTDKRWGLLSLKLLNGVSPPLYIIGIATFPIVGVLIQITIVWLLSLVVGSPMSLIAFLKIALFILFCIIFWSSTLLCIAMLIKNYRQRDFIMNTLMLPIMFSAPLFYSLENAPILLRIISAANPLTYQVEAMRGIAFGNDDIGNILVVIILAVIAFSLATFLLFRVDYNNTEH